MLKKTWVMMSKPIAGFFFLILANFAYATNWLQYHKTADVLYSVEIDDAKLVDGYAGFWAKAEYTKDQKNSAIPSAYRSQLLRLITHCDTGKIAVTRELTYSKTGKVVKDRSEQPTVASFADPIPDSVSASMATTMCKILIDSEMFKGREILNSKTQ